MPASASVSVAANSTSSHFWNLFSSLQTRPISRVYNVQSSSAPRVSDSGGEIPCSIIPDSGRKELGLKITGRGAEGDALGSDVQCAAEGEFTGAAAECFFGANARDVRRIILFGEVREDKMLRARIK